MSENSIEASCSIPQKNAIEHFKGPMMVLAGPGSGKTFVITRRIRYLINNYKVDPNNILVITFTKNSAIEMKERFISLMDDQYMPVTFGTFHAVYLSILKESFGYDAGSIITEKEKYDYMRNAINYHNHNNENQITYEIIPLLLNEISRIKNTTGDYNYISINGYGTDDLKIITDEYLLIMSNLKKLDFDDIILQCKQNLLCNNDELLYWQMRYKYILIDEFQDINPAQYDVIKLIAGKECNLFVVGDDDQSIYGFRGSEPGIMLGFPGEYNNCRQVILNTNYRCNNDIVNKAISLINHNKKRFKKDIIANKKSNKKVTLQSFDSLNDENNKIIELIKLIKRKDIYSDIAIIYRTNFAALSLTRLLNDNDIPFIFKEKVKSIYKTPLSKDILSILDFAFKNNSRENFLRFMNKPVRYIPRNIIDDEKVNINELIKKLSDKYYVINNLKRLQFDLDRISSMDMFQAIMYIRRQMLLEDYYLKDAANKHTDINEVKNNLEILQETAGNARTYDLLLEKIEEYESSLNSTDDNKKDGVSILTMHGSKGLEYKTVIIPDICEGYIPSPKALSEDAIEEERRMFYVAMTRAKENLFLMYTNKNGERIMTKSRFISEIKDLKIID